MLCKVQISPDVLSVSITANLARTMATPQLVVDEVVVVEGLVTVVAGEALADVEVAGADLEIAVDEVVDEEVHVGDEVVALIVVDLGISPARRQLSETVLGTTDFEILLNVLDVSTHDDWQAILFSLPTFPDGNCL